MTTKSVIAQLVREGVIPADNVDVASKELVRELSRRSRRMSTILAIITERKLRSRLQSFIDSRVA